MSDLIYINGNLVNSNLIIEYPIISESASLNSDISIPEGCDIVLDDTDGVHNPLQPGSLLYGRGIGAFVEVYSAELGRYRFKGKIDDINVSGAEKRVTLTVSSVLSGVKDANCVLTAFGITPAAAIRRILTDNIGYADQSIYSLEYPIRPAKGLVPASYLNMATFTAVEQYQAANRCTVNIAIEDAEADSANVTVSDVIRKLCDIGHCSLFSYGGLISVYQWRGSTGSAGYPLTSANIIGGIDWHYSQEEAFRIRNDYRIAYADGDLIKWATDHNSDSIAENGLCRFCIPDESVHSSGSEDYTIILDNYYGAKWCGDMALTRGPNKSKEFKISVPYDLEIINVGSTVSPAIAPYTGMNIVVIGREVSRADRKIELVGIAI